VDVVLCGGLDQLRGGPLWCGGEGAARREAGTPGYRASVVVSRDPRRRGNDNPAGLRKQETG
jgi:hypothetical protein